MILEKRGDTLREQELREAPFILIVFSHTRKYLQMYVPWKIKASRWAQGGSPSLKVKPVTMTPIFIPEERTAAGTKRVEVASGTRNHKPDKTQREMLMEMLAVKDQKPKLPGESRV